MLALQPSAFGGDLAERIATGAVTSLDEVTDAEWEYAVDNLKYSRPSYNTSLVLGSEANFIFRLKYMASAGGAIYDAPLNPTIAANRGKAREAAAVMTPGSIPATGPTGMGPGGMGRARARRETFPRRQPKPTAMRKRRQGDMGGFGSTPASPQQTAIPPADTTPFTTTTAPGAGPPPPTMQPAGTGGADSTVAPITPGTSPTTSEPTTLVQTTPPPTTTAPVAGPPPPPTMLAAGMGGMDSSVASGGSGPGTPGATTDASSSTGGPDSFLGDSTTGAAPGGEGGGQEGPGGPNGGTEGGGGPPQETNCSYISRLSKEDRVLVHGLDFLCQDTSFGTPFIATHDGLGLYLAETESCCPGGSTLASFAEMGTMLQYCMPCIDENSEWVTLMSTKLLRFQFSDNFQETIVNSIGNEAMLKQAIAADIVDRSDSIGILGMSTNWFDVFVHPGSIKVTVAFDSKAMEEATVNETLLRWLEQDIQDNPPTVHLPITLQGATVMQALTLDPNMTSFLEFPDSWKFGFEEDELNMEAVVNPSSDVPFYPLLDADYGVCYQFRPPGGTTSTAYTAGELSPHDVELMTSVNLADTAEHTLHAGTLITLHGPNGLGRPGSQTVLVPPGMSATIGIKKIVIDRLPPPYSDCVIGGKPRGLCEFEEAFVYVQQECGCINYYETDWIINRDAIDATFLPCSTPDDWSCVVNASYFLMLEENYNRIIGDVCVRPPCYEEKYEIFLKGTLPTTAGFQNLTKHLVESSVASESGSSHTFDNSVFRDMSVAKIFYDDLNVIRYTDVEVMSMLDLIGGIGGYFGLFLGFSLMTFVEVMEWGFVGLLGIHKRGPRSDIEEGEEDEEAAIVTRRESGDEKPL